MKFDIVYKYNIQLPLIWPGKFCNYKMNAKQSIISNGRPFFKRIWLISLPLKMHCGFVEPVSNTSEAYIQSELFNMLICNGDDVLFQIGPNLDSKVGKCVQGVLGSQLIQTFWDLHFGFIKKYKFQAMIIAWIRFLPVCVKYIPALLRRCSTQLCGSNQMSGKDKTSFRRKNQN